MNKVPFFATISDHIKFTTAEHIPLHLIKQVIKCKSNVKDIYTAHGFEPKHALMDGKFFPMKSRFVRLQIALNTTDANDHVPKIEHQTCIIKE